MCAALTGALALATVVAQAAPAANPDEFTELQRQLASRKTWNNERLRAETLRQEALILATDATPVDIVWRRTRALADHLRARHPGLDLGAELRELDGLGAAVKASRTNIPAEAALRELCGRIAAVRRAIAFKNPLLDFDSIVFLKHNMQARGEPHMVDQFLGFNAQKAGGVYILERPFSANPTVRSLLADRQVGNGRLGGQRLENAGSFIGLDLDYDASTILFAFTETGLTNAGLDQSTLLRSSSRMAPWDFIGYRSWNPAINGWNPQATYHVFKASLAGNELTQLTDGAWNDSDPCFLPDGGILFVSDRNGGHTRCSGRPLLCARLHRMARDGSGLTQLSWHDTSEWQPSIDHNGMVVYTRWDYVDRDPDCTQVMWTCSADGRNPRSYHGNYPAEKGAGPYMELGIRAIPGSWRYLAAATPHHGQQYGTLILIDPRIPDDRRMSQVRRITPEIPFPESETPWYSTEVFGTPWPLSEDFYLCVYSRGDCRHGIYLVDSFGNRELLYRDPAIGCLDPIPLKARPRPPSVPVLPPPRDADPALGTVVIKNVYQSDQPWPPGVKIKALRVVNVFPKDNPFVDNPNIGLATESLARGVLGTVPVEEDGSAHFLMPTGTSVYFQILDEQGLAVQSMRSATYLHSGEIMSCDGCHEPKTRSPSTSPRVPLALRRGPSRLAPEPVGSYPLTFARLVQPVLDANCVACHDKSSGSPSLRGDWFVEQGWSEAFRSLKGYAWATLDSVRNQRGWQISTPGKEGARASKLYQLLMAKHYGVTLRGEELRRITLWLDCNSNFYGAYHDLEAQARGALIKPRLGTPAGQPFELLAR